MQQLTRIVTKAAEVTIPTKQKTDVFRCFWKQSKDRDGK